MLLLEANSVKSPLNFVLFKKKQKKKTTLKLFIGFIAKIAKYSLISVSEM